MFHFFSITDGENHKMFNIAMIDFYLNFFFKIFKLTDLKEKKKLMSFRFKVILMTIVYICTSSP